MHWTASIQTEAHFSHLVNVFWWAYRLHHFLSDKSSQQMSALCLSFLTLCKFGDESIWIIPFKVDGLKLCFQSCFIEDGSTLSFHWFYHVMWLFQEVISSEILDLWDTDTFVNMELFLSSSPVTMYANAIITSEKSFHTSLIKVYTNFVLCIILIYFSLHIIF